MEETDAQNAPGNDAPPQWNLQQAFNVQSAADINTHVRDLEIKVKRFAEEYKGKIGALRAQELHFAVVEYEKIQESLSTLQGWRDISATTGEQEAFFTPRDLRKIDEFPAQVSFFVSEINEMSEEVLYDRMQNPALQKYIPWIIQTRALHDQRLSDTAETYLQLKSPTTYQGWRDFYDLVLDNIEIKNGDQVMSLEQGLDFLHSGADKAQRLSVFKQIAQALRQNESALTLVTNSLAQLRHLEDQWRGFDDAKDQQYAEARMDDAVVDSMIKAVRDSYTDTVHRYYAWKSEKKDTTRLAFAERDADLFGQDSPTYTWAEARRLVTVAFKEVSPDVGDTVERIFNSGRVDGKLRGGKLKTEFVKVAGTDNPPFVSSHFDGSARSVRRLARLMGQAVQLEMSRKKGPLMQAPSPALTEMVGVWGEALVFEHQMTGARDNKSRRALLVERVEDMLEKIVRPVVLATFENTLHAEYRKKGELSAERIAEVWLNARKQSYGSAVNMDGADVKLFWMLERDTIHEPFASYTKAFGECLVHGIDASFKVGRVGTHMDFTDRVEELLSAGGTMRYDRAILDLGVDMDRDKFWTRAMAGVSDMISRLIVLDKAIEQPAPGTGSTPPQGPSS